METQAPKRSSDGSATSAADETQEPKTDNGSLDAWSRSLATIDPAILNHVIEIASGLHCKDENFKTCTGTVLQLLERLMLVRDAAGTQRVGWARGAKDGACILQGGLIAGARSAKNVRANHIVMVDYDTGYSIEEIAAAIHKRGLFALLWTTHSHLKSETLIAEGALVKWAAGREIDVALAGAYLAEVKKYKPDIAASVSSVERVHVDGGINFKMIHAPMPRVRALFVLAQAFDFAKRGSTQAEAIREWKERYIGLCKSLGLPWDTSCVDPSRLMYTPLIAKEADERKHEFRIVPGVTLDLEKVVQEKQESTKAGKKSTKNSKSQSPAFVTPGLAGFLAAHAGDFEAARFMEEHEPDGVRHDYGCDKLDFCCPNEDNHTTPMPDDRAFCVENASARENGFWMHCQHDTCKDVSGGDRAWFLDVACQKYGVTDASELEEWCPAAQEEAAREKEQEQTLAELINSLTPACTPDQIDAVVGRIADINKTQAAKDALLRGAAEKVDGKWTGRVETKWRRYFNDANGRRAKTESKSDTAPGSSPPPDSGASATVIWSSWDNDVKNRLLEERMLSLNKETPRWFRREEGGSVRLVDGSSGVAVEELYERDAWSYEISRAVTCKRMTENRVVLCTAPFPSLVTHMRGGGYRVFPVIDRIVHVPVFNAAGTLLTKRGYDADARIFLDPPDGVKFRQVEIGEITPTDVADAVALFDEVFRDFPFSDAFDGADPLPVRDGVTVDEDGFPLPTPGRGVSSKAHAISMVLEFFARGLIDGPCPMYAVSAPIAGTGKDTVVLVPGYIVDGEPFAASTLPKSEEEIRKEMISRVRSGDVVIWWNNTEHAVKSRTLESAQTSSRIKGRILGVSQTVDVPFRATVIIDGNNLSLSFALVRRALPIRIDANTPNPARDRVKGWFKRELEPFLKSRRIDLVWAAHILVGYWIQKGRPDFTGTPLLSFSAYSRTIGGILACAGVPGFLANIDAYQQGENEESDEDAALFEYLAKQPDVVGFRFPSEGSPVVRGITPQEIAEMLSTAYFDVGNLGIDFDGAREEGAAKRVGKHLSKLRNQSKVLKDGRTVKLVRQREERGTVYRLYPTDM